MAINIEKKEYEILNDKYSYNSFSYKNLKNVLLNIIIWE